MDANMVQNGYTSLASNDKCQISIWKSPGGARLSLHSLLDISHILPAVAAPVRQQCIWYHDCYQTLDLKGHSDED